MPMDYDSEGDHDQKYSKLDDGWSFNSLYI
jgi:hypothetical protein